MVSPPSSPLPTSSPSAPTGDCPPTTTGYSLQSEWEEGEGWGGNVRCMCIHICMNEYVYTNPNVSICICVYVFDVYI